MIDSDCKSRFSRLQWRFQLSFSVNEVVPSSRLLETAIKYAQAINENSPDAVQSTKRGLITSLQHGSVEEAFITHAWSQETKKVRE